MTRLLHVLPGPEEHGVVRHGLGLQEHLDADVLRCERLDAPSYRSLFPYPQGWAG